MAAMFASAATQDERQAMKEYWAENSQTPTVEAMMLDSQAATIDKEERPEVGRGRQRS